MVTQDQNEYKHNALSEEDFKHTTLVVQSSKGKPGIKGFGTDGEKIYHEIITTNNNPSLTFYKGNGNLATVDNQRGP